MVTGNLKSFEKTYFFKNRTYDLRIMELLVLLCNLDSHNLAN